MKRPIFFALLFFLLLTFGSCGEKPLEDQPILADINGFRLTLDEFQTRLAEEMEYDPDYKLEKEAKKEFLENIIKKELLIQEAKRLNLDKEEVFIRAIERYWEATLIKDLLELKGREISKKILISQEEIKAGYDAMSMEDNELPPLSEMEEQIVNSLKEKKKTMKLKEWIESLRKESSVDIDTRLLYQN